MSFICKASFLTRGRQLIIQTDSLKKAFLVSLTSRNTGQLSQPLSQARLLSTENKNQSNDNLERLYDGVLHKKIKMVKIFSLVTSAGSILCQPYLISRALETGTGTGAIGGIVVTFGFFAFITPILLHMITKRYVISIDYNHAKQTYIAKTYSLFAQKKEVEFTPDDVTLPTMSEMLTTCMVKGKPMFMDVLLFTDVQHYKKIMGFDKPMDFSLNAESIKSRKD